MGLAPLLAGGCMALATPVLLWGEEPTRTVAAEYPYLADRKVCVVVRAELETLVEYPHVQFELADHVRAALEQHVPRIGVVEPRRVVDFQRQGADWERMDPAALGRRFGADRLVEIDLTQYTTREPESPYLYRGYIAAAVSVYNTDYPDSAPAYTTTVRVVYPPESAGAYGTSDREVRRATMEAFAEELAGRFYERKVKVK